MNPPDEPPYEEETLADLRWEIGKLQERNSILRVDLAKEKGGWDAFYKLRKAVGEDRYPGMTGEVKATDTAPRAEWNINEDGPEYVG